MTWVARTACLLLLAAVLAPRAKAEEDAGDPLWRRCYTAIDWYHAADVPDTESTLLELVMGGKVAAASQAWVRKAIADAPGFDEILAEAKARAKLLLWYVPHVEGQHMILPHLLDRYMMVGPLSHPEVTELVHEHFLAVKLPMGGTLSERLGLRAPAFLEPALLIVNTAGTVVERLDRISVFDPVWLRSQLLEALSRQGVPLRPVARVGPTQEARALMRRGQFDDAERLLRRLLRTTKDKALQAEAGYELGYALYFLKQEDEAQRVWAQTASRHPDSIWGAKADAYARRGTDGAFGEGPIGRSMLNPLRTFRPWSAGTPTRAPAEPTRGERIDRVRRTAVRFLLVQQRSDGSWEGPRWGASKDNPDGPPGYGNIKTAITALCSAALLTSRDTMPKPVDVALERAEAFLLADKHVKRGEQIVWTYADAFRLLHFARRLPSLKTGARSRVRKRMQRWIRFLIDHQAENDGSFRHYTYRSTFVTACVTYCLHFAKQAGLDVPDEVFKRAADRIEGAQGGPRKLYGYLLDAPQVTRSLLGASGRHPLCEWTLHLVGRRSADALDRAMDVFFEGYAAFEQARKTNFHVPALDNTCGYYFFHDFYPACEAARASGDNAKRNGERMRDLLLALADDDGTFIDAGFSYGKSYSTAMALLSLHALGPPSED